MSQDGVGQVGGREREQAPEGRMRLYLGPVGVTEVWVLLFFNNGAAEQGWTRRLAPFEPARGAGPGLPRSGEGGLGSDLLRVLQRLHSGRGS